MSHKQNIDTYFRKVFDSNGPVISEQDEERFLQNMRALKNKKKRYFGLYIFYYGVGILCMIGVGYFITGTSGQRQVDPEFKSGLTRKEALSNGKQYSRELPEKKAVQHDKKISQTNNESLSLNHNLQVANQLKTQQWQRKLPSENQTDLNPENAMTGNVESITEKMPASSIEEAMIPSAEILLGARGIAIQSCNNMFDITEVFPEPKLSKKIPVRNTWRLNVYSGLVLSACNWQANGNAQSHKDLANIAGGMQTKGSGIINGLNLEYGLNRWFIGAGLSRIYIQDQTIYTQGIANIPVIDSATGIIKGYINRGNDKAFLVEKGNSVRTQWQIPFMAGYRVYQGMRSRIELLAGMGFTFAGSTGNKPFDPNTMQVSVGSANWGKFSSQLGVNYYFKPSSRFEFGLRFQLQTSQIKYNLKFGNEVMKNYGYCVSPAIKFNLF